MKSGHNSATDLVREVDLEELISNRAPQDRQESRNRRIARLDRLWKQRKLLGKFVLRGMIDAIIIPPRYASTT